MTDAEGGGSRDRPMQFNKPEPDKDSSKFKEMEAQIWAAGASLEEAAFIAQMLWRNGQRIVPAPTPGARAATNEPYIIDGDCEDQALVATKVCTLFPCQTWEGVRQIKPQLEKRGKFWCCPKCGSSYGENPHPDLR